MDFKKAYLEKYDESFIDKMNHAKIGIAGLGGLGSNIAMMLMRAGVRNFVIADFDVVEPTNLNRQNYFQKHLGMKKTDATEQVLNDLDPEVTIEKYFEYIDQSNIAKIFKDVDIIVEAFDNPKSKATLVNYVLNHFDVPIVSASGIGGYLSSNNIKSKRKNEQLYLVGDDFAAGDSYPMISPRVMIGASHQANMVVRLIQGEQEV